MNTAELWSLRQQASESGDCELSRLCSAALWGETHQKRSGAKRAIKAELARRPA